MIRKYNNISLALGIPGLVLQVAGKLMENNAVLVVGLLLLLAGFAYYVDAGRYVHAVQIVFMRIGSDGRLDPSDRYTSDWLGFRTEKSPTTIGGTGAVVLGVQGRGAAVVDALGLVLRGR